MGVSQQSLSPYGLLAEFEQGEELLAAAHAAIRRRLSANERLHAFPSRRIVTKRLGRSRRGCRC